MEKIKLSMKGQKLIELYEKMAIEGYERIDGTYINKKDNQSSSFSSFELRRFKDLLLPYFRKYHIKSLLDYGSGGSNWESEGFDKKNSNSAKEFFLLEKVFLYEPALKTDQRKEADCRRVESRLLPNQRKEAPRHGQRRAVRGRRSGHRARRVGY